jgi:hypothetical protein
MNASIAEQRFDLIIRSRRLASFKPAGREHYQR